MNQYLKNHPFWCICSLFCLGVFISATSEQLLVPALIISALIGVVLYYFGKSISSSLFIFLSFILFFTIGIFRHQICDHKYQPNHITNSSDNVNPQKVTLRITEIFKASAKATNYKVKIHSINDEKSKGYALLSLVKEDDNTSYKLGDSFVGYLKLKPIKKTGNPYVFEYADYLKNQKITHKIWTGSKQLHTIAPLANSWVQFSNKIRGHLEGRLKKQQLLPKVFQITEALVLGNKSRLSTELKTDFVNAGVIHILAISGLHIGILYLLINGFFSLFLPYSKNSIFIALTVVCILWLFAWFSGGSHSALRATTMFTCFQFSKLLSRPQHPINALFFSCLILVFINPLTVFSVGFQLSVTAVAAIIIGVPKLLNFWYPKNWLVRKIWSIICLSLCAQIGILPLSFYYFHQFSGAFLLANIPIMLVISFVLTAAILIVIFSSFLNIPSFILQLYNEFILTVINYVSWVANFDQFIIKDLYLNLWSVLFCYLFIFFLGLAYYFPRKAYKWSLTVASLGVIIGYWEYQQRIFKNELWLLNQYDNMVITELTAESIKVHAAHKLNEKEIKHLIKPIAGKLHYPVLDTLKLMNHYEYLNSDIHIINGTNDLAKTSKNNIFILDNSPKINVERLVKNHSPIVIIATSHNYTSLVKKWKATCSKEQVAFYTKTQKGAINLTSIINTLKK